MSEATDQLAAQIKLVKEELIELEATLPNWDTWAKVNKTGSKEARAIVGRVVDSARNLEKRVKQHSFD
jgi:hypothetical protein